MVVTFNRKQINEHITGGNYDEIIDIKKEKKVNAVIVQGSDIVKYAYHFFKILKDVEENGKTKKKLVTQPFLCTKSDGFCPACEQLKKLSLDDSIPNDEIVGRVGRGKQQEVIEKGELIGAKNYNSMSSWKPAAYFLISVINYKKQEKAQALKLTNALMKKLHALIEAQIAGAEEDGDDPSTADPFDQGEMVFSFVYDAEADNTNKYQVHILSNKKYTQKIYDIMDNDEPLDKLSLLLSPDVKGMAKAVNSIIDPEFVIDLDEYLGDDEDEEDDEDDEPKRVSSKRSSSKRSRKSEDDEDDEDDEDEKPSRPRASSRRSRKSEDEEEEKPRRRSASRKLEDDEDEEEEKPRRRSRKSDDDEEEKPRRRPRRSTSDDDEEEEKPRRRPRRSTSEDDEEKPSRPRRTSRKSRSTEDDEEEEKPSRSRRSSTKRKAKSEEVLECPNCGIDVEADENECPECGEELTL